MKKELAKSFDQALEISRRFGGRGRGCPRWKPPAPEQIVAIRKELGMTQVEFARNFGLDLGTVRNWEQGRTRPETVPSIYLRLIERDPMSILGVVAELDEEERKKALEFA